MIHHNSVTKTGLNFFGAILSVVFLTVAVSPAAFAKKRITQKFVPGVGINSKLPWHSGVSGVSNSLEQRGSALDLHTGFLTKTGDWALLAKSGLWVTNYVSTGGYVVLGVPMLPNKNRGQLAQCARGDFNDYITTLGKNLVQAGAGNALLRIGWEGDGNGFPWAATGDGSTYRGCFVQWVTTLRKVSPNFTYVWNMSLKGKYLGPIDNLYPGNDYVDIIATERYDRCPSIRTQADWDSTVNAVKSNGSPAGLGSWLAYAKAKGKRLGIGEWGVSNAVKASGARVCGNSYKDGFDNPLFISNVFNFLKANADFIAYESYFNGEEQGHTLFTTMNPLATATYRSLW